jgi:yeast amino acid transporter
MKPRHLNMIAIGGSIGAGFFVGSGSALTSGGPASLFICFLISGVMIFNVVYALGELAVMYPVSGGFYTYSVRFIDPSWGFAMGWNYVSGVRICTMSRANLARSCNGRLSYRLN